MRSFQDLQHWVAPTIGTVIKVGAVVIASYIQAVISAFYSGLRGGRLFGEALLAMTKSRCGKWKDWKEVVYCSVFSKPLNLAAHMESSIAGYSLSTWSRVLPPPFICS